MIVLGGVQVGIGRRQSAVRRGGGGEGGRMNVLTRMKKFVHA